MVSHSTKKLPAMATRALRNWATEPCPCFWPHLLSSASSPSHRLAHWQLSYAGIHVSRIPFSVWFPIRVSQKWSCTRLRWQKRSSHHALKSNMGWRQWEQRLGCWSCLSSIFPTSQPALLPDSSPSMTNSDLNFTTRCFMTNSQRQ